MSRSRGNVKLNIVQLEQFLNERRAELNRLYLERGEAQKKLAAIDKQIHKLSGGHHNQRTGVGGRVHNATSLIDSIDAVLREAGKPMKVADIAQAVLAAGYSSRSANFRGIVNQTLIKDRRFVSSERGSYHLKPAKARKELKVETPVAVV